MACPDKWKQRLKPAVPRWVNFDPYPNLYSTTTKHNISNHITSHSSIWGSESFRQPMAYACPKRRPSLEKLTPSDSPFARESRGQAVVAFLPADTGKGQLCWALRENCSGEIYKTSMEALWLPMQCDSGRVVCESTVVTRRRTATSLSQ